MYYMYLQNQIKLIILFKKSLYTDDIGRITSTQLLVTVFIFLLYTIYKLKKKNMKTGKTLIIIIQNKNNLSIVKFITTE